MALPGDEMLRDVYGDAAEEARGRYEALVRGFGRAFSDVAHTTETRFYSSPGRCEVVGNHTDHNGGRVLAASITQDSICAAAATPGRRVRVVSEGYGRPFVVDLDRLDEVEHVGGTTALLAGIMDGLLGGGRHVGGFDAYVTSQVVPSAGVSSSASFEMLVGQVVSDLFNDGGIPVDELARAGQHAENVFWGKGSGLLDQMACGTGGAVALDFSQGVRCRRVHLSLDDLGMALVLTNTGRGHADLSAEYSAIPDEMRSVAAALGVERLCDTSEEALLADLPRVRELVGSDRAVLRSLHFFEECRRVDEAVACLDEGRPEGLLSIVRASGSSSWRWLQNAAVPGQVAEQPIPLALALSELFLEREAAGRGASRLHGGGFAGVVMCLVPRELVGTYAQQMGRVFGTGSVHAMGIRQAGALRVS